LPSFVTYSTKTQTLTFSPTAVSLLATVSSLTVTLTDSIGASKSFSMSVNVPNRPPYFTDGTTSFAPVTVALNSIFHLPIPAFSDPDLTTPILGLTQVSTPAVMATFMGTTSLKISPTTFTEVGLHTAYVYLSDSLVTIQFSLQITVTNTAPYFTSPTMPFPTLTIPINKQITIPFGYADMESNPITVTVFETFSGTKMALPSSITTLTSPGLITFYPIAFSDIGSHLIEIKLSDGQPLSKLESFTIDVVNNPPYFVKQVPFSVTMKFNLSYEYVLP
jgi:hypothetical protein